MGGYLFRQSYLNEGEDMARKVVKYQIDDKEYSDTGEIFDSLFGKALRKLFRKEKIEKAPDKNHGTRWAIKKKAVSSVEEAQSGVAEVEEDLKTQETESRGRLEAGKGGRPKTAETRKAQKPSLETRKRYGSPISYGKSEITRLKTEAEPKKSLKTRRPSRKKAGKRSNRLRTALALVLLVVLAGALANMYGIVDFGTLSGSLKSIKKKDIPLLDDIGRLVGSLTSSIKGDSKPKAVQKAPEKRNEKPPLLARKAIEKRASGPPQPKKAPSPSKQEMVAKTPKPMAAPQKEAPSSNPIGDVQKGETVNKTVTQTDKRIVSSEEGRLPVNPPVSYPYSIYLGSYKELESAQNTIAEYEKKGLSPFWVRVDLGDKGVWFRIFTNYFKNKEEAEAHIRAKQIPEGKPRRTRYANLIGIFKSREALHQRSAALSKIGYSPYVIPGANGDSLLYTGAFYQRARAEAQRAALASNGIQSRLVER